MHMRQTCNELGIPVRLRPAQIVIEMDNRKDDPQFPVQFQQQTQQRNRINPARNSNTHPIPRTQLFPAANLNQHFLR